MEKRREELMKLKSYTEEIDNELTMILQTLQWDRKHFLQNPMLVTCRYDSNHKVPPDKTEEHEKECFLKQNGYSKDDQLLPDPLDLESKTLVKLEKEDIEQIIAHASRSDSLFKKVYRELLNGLNHLIHFVFFLNQGVGCREAEPLSLECLQMSYSADERRAIHDAVVSAVPSCHDLTDLALLSGADDKSSKVILSRQEILLELRNIRRRRTKYRVAAKSRNYSDVLRDVISTQMEHYNGGKGETEPKDTLGRDNNQRDTHYDRRNSSLASKEDRSRHERKIVPKPIKIKIEREDSKDRNINYSRERSDRAYIHEIGSRDKRDRDNDKCGRDDRSRDRRIDANLERTEKEISFQKYSRKKKHDYETRERRYHYEDNVRKENDQEKDYSADKRSKRSYRHKDYDLEYHVKKVPGLDDEPNNHRDTSRERRHDESREKPYRHKDKKERRRDRERSKERRRDKIYDDGPSGSIHIKQEREDSITRDDTINYKKEKADRKRKSKRHDRSNRDGNCDRRSLEIKRYDGTSEDIYDPNKKIKVEK